MKTALALLCMSLLISCNKVSPPATNLQGTYVGYFHRNRHDTTHVSLAFSENNFKGACTNARYPAVGKGSFEIEDSVIHFTNSGSWSSDLDESFILTGDYNYQNNTDGTIRIWRQENASLDEYILKRHIQ